ncbi:MAG TPA: hypothetical protein PKO03_07790 [Anaerolineaceae bacterium]|nr:hypothetical protein [Anaerolineaceae bacterium]
MKKRPLYEHRSQPLLSRAKFTQRMLKHGAVAFAFLFICLGIGMLGYRITEGLPWIDALLNAAMILGGMGPVNALHTVAGKLFASAYAIFSGVAFLVTASILMAPLAHRLLHRLHLDMEGEG